MGSVQLLDRTRRIGKLLRDKDDGRVRFEDICRILSENTGANCLLLSKKGKVLGAANTPEVKVIDELLTDEVGAFIDKSLNERMIEILSTKENVNIRTLGFEETDAKAYHLLVIPIFMSGDRFGTLLIYRNSEEFDIDDIILCEYSTSIIGLEMLRSVAEEIDREKRRVQSAQSAMASLSAAEVDALVEIFKELNNLEGVLVASKIADRMGITRSVIVNAMRKLESAGVIEAKSSGMKGTYIKILNDCIFDELKKVRQ